jgi:hypothetical protein
MKTTDFVNKQPKKIAEAKVEAPVVKQTHADITFAEFDLDQAERQYAAEGVTRTRKLKEAGPAPVDTQKLKQSLEHIQKFAGITASFSKEQKYNANDIESNLRRLQELWSGLGLGNTGSDVDYAIKDAIEAVNSALSTLYGVDEAVKYVAKSIQNSIEDAEYEDQWSLDNPNESVEEGEAFVSDDVWRLAKQLSGMQNKPIEYFGLDEIEYIANTVGLDPKEVAEILELTSGKRGADDTVNMNEDAGATCSSAIAVGAVGGVGGKNPVKSIMKRQQNYTNVQQKPRQLKVKGGF